MKAEIRRLTERAADEGLIDVAYTTTDSPFGELLLAGTSRGLVRVGLPGQEPDELLEDLAARISPRVLEAPDRLEEARRELDSYFEGGLTEFDLPLDWRLSHDFRRRVLRAIDRIPYGQDPQLHGGRRQRRQRPCRPRRRLGLRLEPDSDRRPLPPGAAHRRRAGRVWRRPADEAGPARARGRA